LQLDDVDSAAFEGEQKWDSRFERRVTSEEGRDESWRVLQGEKRALLERQGKSGETTDRVLPRFEDILELL
jgi:hypothetical protein